jgi:regulator of sigma D
MTKAQKKPLQERRARTRKEIKQLIAERNSVLSQYYNLASHTDNNNDDDTETVLEMLQEFCQDLVDYMATGHFEIYRRIEDGDERRDEMVALANEVFPKITTTTEVAMNFNDLYDMSKDFNSDVLKDLSKQLTTLGVHLAARIDLEDKFINTLLDTTSPQTA